MATRYFDASVPTAGAASALASDAFSITITNTCGRPGAALATADTAGVSLGDGVGATGAVGAGAVAASAVGAGAVALGDAQALTISAIVSQLPAAMRIPPNSPVATLTLPP